MDAVTGTVVATANVLGRLGRAEAREAVAAVLEHRPDLVALQEWHPWRAGLLGGFDEYAWKVPLLGGCAVGARRERYALVSHSSRMLSPPGRADREGRVLGLEPARVATIMVLRDQAARSTVALVDYHLASQVQRAGRYREDRPVLVARHRREAATLLRLVGAELAAGRAAYACGDSNFHGFRLPPLVSAWAGRVGAGGTLGPDRQVDDVHALVAPAHVRTVAPPSDHLAVVATYA